MSSIVVAEDQERKVLAAGLVVARMEKMRRY